MFFDACTELATERWDKSAGEFLPPHPSSGTMPPAIAERLTSALDGRYVLERELGAGGMATVWLARDLRHDRMVALKVLRAELTAVLGAERFLDEIRLTARLDQPHILTLIDSGEADGLLFYVLPYVRGESLRARLDHEKQLPLDDAVRLVRQVASALAYAHSNGVVHRDIKPENILLHEGEAVVTDFGIALALREAGGTRLTESGLSLGTPQYMSPEQATGDRELDARSDVYSLGAVLYELIAGDPPHAGATVQAVIAKLLTEKPTSLRTLRNAVPERLEDAVFKALSKVPADRFKSASTFSDAIAAGLTQPERSMEPATSSWSRTTSVMLGFSIGISAATAVVGGWTARRTGDNCERARFWSASHVLRRRRRLRALAGRAAVSARSTRMPGPRALRDRGGGTRRARRHFTTHRPIAGDVRHAMELRWPLRGCRGRRLDRSLRTLSRVVARRACVVPRRL